jgi:pyruvate kinase
LYKQTKIIATVGPACDSREGLRQLVEAGVDAFRLPVDRGSEAWRDQVVADIRAVEQVSNQPLAILADFGMPSGPAGAGLGDEIDEPAIAWSVRRGIDFLAVSAGRGTAILERARQAVRTANGKSDIVARIDSAAAVTDIDGIARVADGVMVTAAGLAELDYWAAPIAQKSIARQCQLAAKPCIVGRPLLAGMSTRREPAAVEVFDLANAVFDHFDAVLVEDPTYDGVYPVDAVHVARQTLAAAEGYLEVTDRPLKVGFGQPPNAAALAYAIRHILKMQEIAAVAIYSVTGFTATLIAKNWLDCPILAFSADAGTARRMALLHGVIPRISSELLNTEDLLRTASELAKRLQIAQTGDRIIIVSGQPVRTRDRANGFLIEEVR